MKPVIALVGRPNVGKSTLFNRLTRSRAALVADYPGLTRDRHYGEGRMGDRPFLVIDTGGFEPVVKEGVLQEMAKQTKQAVAEADVVIFIVDGRQGITPHDKNITDYLRKCGRPVILAVNKAEGMKYTAVVADFYELGMGDPFVISSAHGDGVHTLLDEALKRIPCAPAGMEEELVEEQDHIRLAIVGRPNVGKSTMINALLGEERVIAFDLPGTTRDAIDSKFENQQGKYIFIDTAGLRRKAKVKEEIERFSVIRKSFRLSKHCKPFRKQMSCFCFWMLARIFRNRMPILPVLFWRVGGPWLSESINGMVCLRTSARKSNRKRKENCIFCLLQSSTMFPP